MSMGAKQNRPKARLPRGFFDRLPGEIAATREMMERIRQVFELYGFEALETPALEYTDALGKFLPDQDRPNEGVFSFQDDDEQWLSLRYDLTAPLARYVAENFDSLPKPYRSYRAGWVFRNEKPGPGRFRQFFQYDADTVGSASPAADAEFCMIAADTMEAVGLRRGDFVVKVNNRKVLDGILESVGLSGEAQAGKRLTVMRAIDKFERLGVEGVTALLGAGRKDESGDFTKGAGLSGEQIDQIMYIFASPQILAQSTDQLPDWEVQDSRFNAGSPVSNRATINALRTRFPNIVKYQEGLDELEQIAELAHAAEYGSRRILIDLSVVRGLEYYTGAVFEVEPTLEITDASGRAVRLGSLGGGGRYDGLVARFRGDTVPATGFSVGVSRLTAALVHLGKIAVESEPGPVVVLVMDRDRIADYQRLAGRLRAAGIRAEIYLGQAGMKAQMKYADRRRACCVIIQGSEERARGEVQIRDLIEGAKAAAAIASNQEWRATRPAQFPVGEAALVEAVHEVLRRHNVAWALSR